MGKYKFNVGDKLRVVEGSGTFNVGDIVTCDRNINSNEDNCIDVILSNGNKSASWLASRFKLVEENSSLKGNFNVGDRVRVINYFDGEDMKGMVGTIKVIKDSSSSSPIGVEFDEDFGAGHNLDNNSPSGRGRWGREDELIKEETPSKNVCKMTKKTVYSVFILDKKTGKVTKDVKVTADNEQQAILKTFGVDAENTFIRIVELGTYEEDKPIKAVIEEKPKK